MNNIAPPQKVNGAGMYVHVPFCVRKCCYCDFNSIPVSTGQPSQYMLVIGHELAALHPSALAGAELNTLYIGGGTPTVLPTADLTSLVQAACQSAWPQGLSPAGVEITVEANPGTLQPGQLAALLAVGVNRLSLGVQSFNNCDLHSLGRIHNAAEAEAGLRQARAAGFANINIDLMFAIPGQTLASWRATLHQAVDLAPEHISCYSLIVEPGTPLQALVANKSVQLPGEDVELEMYREAIRFLSAAGYNHYEISNFAKPGYWCLHNINYWLNGFYIGVGPGAHGHIPGWRLVNEPDPARYAAKLFAGNAAEVERISIDIDTAMDDTMIMGLRLLQGVFVPGFYERFGVAVQDVYGAEIERLERLGLLELAGYNLRLTAKGLPIANQVFMAFLRD